MQQNPTEILEQYWGYSHFRPGQESVVQDILNGKEVLALFPTGGGKSICFQVPGLMLQGCTLVVSPLVSLMKDQADSLKRRNIMAAHLYSGLAREEIALIMENAMQGRYKFIYVSPERLESESFREYLPALNLSLLVVDEAHCISQWGHDFRPSYLRIAEIRQVLPQLKIAAFTASAPLRVQKDIVAQLAMAKVSVHKADFNRPNLRFYAIETENKSGYILKALSRSKGSAIVFCDTRRETEEMSRFLYEHQISCDFYHAGLPQEQRSKKQDQWIKNQTRVMVCTNAFGMGVDKPDVRVVFHQAPPSSPEAYYQEAGRAGRDGEPSWCFLLHRNGDVQRQIDNVVLSFPEIKDLNRVYHAVHNYCNIADGGGEGLAFEFDLKAVAERYKMPQLLVLNCVKNIEFFGYWSVSESVFTPSRIHFKWPYEYVYDLKIKKPEFEPLLDVLLRSYGGVFESYVGIAESTLAKRLHQPVTEIVKDLHKLQGMGVVDYLPTTDKPVIYFLEPRNANPVFPIKLLEPLRKTRLEAIGVMQQYLLGNQCRSAFWQQHFGGESAADCGLCDVCIQKKKKALNPKNRQELEKEIKQLLKNTGLSRQALLDLFPHDHAYELRVVLRELMDDRTILVDANHKLYWKV